MTRLMLKTCLYATCQATTSSLQLTLSFDLLLTTISLSAIKTVLLVPLSILVLYLGHRQWRQQHSFATMSHSDIFTCHVAVLELTGALGFPIYFYGHSTDFQDIRKVGFCFFSITFFGEVLFHIVTCLEWYLAVVHPITYLGLKRAGWVRIRNISTGCVWLLSFGSMGITAFYFPYLRVIPVCCLLVFSFIVVSLLSLSVLWVLIRRGPGKVGGDREQVDQSKQRAFHSIMTIMGVLLLWFVGYLVCLVLGDSPLLNYSVQCLVVISGMWFGLPSSLVLPLLFLHRAGQLPFSCSEKNLRPTSKPSH